MAISIMISNTFKKVKGIIKTLFYIKREDGSYLLREDGSKILREK